MKENNILQELRKKIKSKFRTPGRSPYITTDEIIDIFSSTLREYKKEIVGGYKKRLRDEIKNNTWTLGTIIHNGIEISIKGDYISRKQVLELLDSLTLPSPKGNEGGNGGTGKLYGEVGNPHIREQWASPKDTEEKCCNAVNHCGIKGCDCQKGKK